MRRIQLTETVTRDGFGDRIVALAGVVAVTATGMHHQTGAVYVYGPGAPAGALLVSAPDALLAFVPSSLLRAPEHARGVRTNDNWGWTDPETGREYALVGRNEGTSFIDITDTNPVPIGDLPKGRCVTEPGPAWATRVSMTMPVQCGPHLPRWAVRCIRAD